MYFDPGLNGSTVQVREDSGFNDPLCGFASLASETSEREAAFTAFAWTEIAFSPTLT